MTTDTPGIVYLVGAGPGDPELLTLRAHRLLQRCDALVHDSLVPMELLELVPEGCEIHPVGKRRGHHSVPQPSTNALLQQLAGRCRCVVRLKGAILFCLAVVVKKPLIWPSAVCLLRWFPGSPPALRRRPMSGFR